MNKNFNSFRDMIDGAREASGFRSFRDWAKNTLEPSQPQEPQAQAMNEEVMQEKVELPVDPVVEEAIDEDDDIVATLLEKLADFDWGSGETEERPILKQKVEEKPKAPRPVHESVRTPEPKVEERRLVPPAPAMREEPKVEETRDYRVFKDRDENFECQLSVEGTSLADAKVRIVLESDAWNFVFYGQVYGDGKCIVPLKKGIPLIEGATGKIKLEVIAEDQLFVGWEDQFRVTASKKVKVAVKEQKSIKVSFNNSLND